MAFPDDLSDVVVFKIHPAIGIARVAKNDDFFVFGTDPGTYKSNKRMKRQAVKFRVFAYGENHVGLGELTPAVMDSLGIAPVWSAKVANRKIAFMESEPLSSNVHVVRGEAASDDANEGKLTGALADFEEGREIPLGQITGEGVFIPPKAGVHRKTLGLPVPNYPNFTNEIADGSSDGIVSVTLGGPDAVPPVLPACIVVAPGDYSPDAMPQQTPGESLLLRLRRDLASAPTGGTLHNETTRKLDEAALQPCTGDFAPGFEVSFGGRGEVRDIATLFHTAANNPLIEPGELRVRYRASPADPGAEFGQLTSGLCSPWQTDFTACVGYWSENLPARAFLDEDDQVGVQVYRKKYDDRRSFIPPGDKLTNGDDFERHQDEVGVVRIRDGRQIETEREPGDNIVEDGTS